MYTSYMPELEMRWLFLLFFQVATVASYKKHDQVTRVWIWKLKYENTTPWMLEFKINYYSLISCKWWHSILLPGSIIHIAYFSPWHGFCLLPGSIIHIAYFSPWHGFCLLPGSIIHIAYFSPWHGFCLTFILGKYSENILSHGLYCFETQIHI